MDLQSGFLSTHPSWKIIDGRLVSEFEFRDYRSAVLFFLRLSFLARKENHHPEVTVSFRRVRVSLFTFDSNEITEKDIKSAEETDKIYLKWGSVIRKIESGKTHCLIRCGFVYRDSAEIRKNSQSEIIPSLVYRRKP